MLHLTHRSHNRARKRTYFVENSTAHLLKKQRCVSVEKKKIIVKIRMGSELILHSLYKNEEFQNPSK
jgi:hypothetical protein